MADKKRKSMVDLREFPAALDLARALYRDNDGHLRQMYECSQIAELLGLSNIAVWHAYHRGDLGVPSPNPARAQKHGQKVNPIMKLLINLANAVRAYVGNPVTIFV